MKAWLAALALTIATAAATLAAQTPPDPRKQLDNARAQAADARQLSAELEARARAAGDEAGRARAAQGAVAARIQVAEADIATAGARLAILVRLQREQERRLAVRQQPIVKLVAALQTMARRPAAAALVQPGTVSDLVHVRAALSTMVPQIAAQTEGLRAEVERARHIRAQASAALASQREGQRQLGLEQRRLAQLETEQRRKSLRFASSARLESERALTLGENTRDLEELVRSLDAEAALRARLASLPGPLPRPARLSENLPPAEATSAQAARLAYRFPVLGRIARGFGEILPSGARSRGVAIAARPGAIVVAPGQGRVTFAGLYRGYGAIAIIDHGDGYVSLLTGLASNIARVGDIVDQGSPLGRAGADAIMVELRLAGEPIDLTTLIG